MLCTVSNSSHATSPFGGGRWSKFVRRVDGGSVARASLDSVFALVRLSGTRLGIRHNVEVATIAADGATGCPNNVRPWLQDCPWDRASIGRDPDLDVVW